MNKKRKLPRKGSQAWRILEHLRSNGTLTTRQAVEVLNVLRLPNRISELRNLYGIKIYQRIVTRGNGSGRVRWAEYSLYPFEKAVPESEKESR